MRHIGMEEVGWWGDPREGFILTKPYMARRHVRHTEALGSTGAFFFSLILAAPVCLHRVRPLRSGESRHWAFAIRLGRSWASHEAL